MFPNYVNGVAMHMAEQVFVEQMCGSLAVCRRMVELGAMVFILLFEFSTMISRRPY